jgi:flagella basal body P-ring formation protein FlgA
MFLRPILLLIAALLPIHGMAQSLELRQEALVDHARIVLSDVAGVPAGFASIELGRAPRIGYVERFSRMQIEQAIRRHVVIAGAPNWSGAPAVAVRTKTQGVSAQALVEVAMTAAAAQFGGVGRNLSLSLATPLSDVEVPVGRLQLRPRAVPANVRGGRAPVWVDLLVEGEFYRTVAVQLAIAARQQVYVARFRLEPGALAQAQDFAPADTDVAGADVVPADRPLLPFRVGRAIRAGQPLMPAAMLQTGQIMRGDRVRVRIDAGQIGIETAAVAMSDARPGEALNVRPAGGRDVVTGRVSQSGTVVIE